MGIGFRKKRGNARDEGGRSTGPAADLIQRRAGRRRDDRDAWRDDVNFSSMIVHSSVRKRRHRELMIDRPDRNDGWAVGRMVHRRDVARRRDLPGLDGDL